MSHVAITLKYHWIYRTKQYIWIWRLSIFIRKVSYTLFFFSQRKSTIAVQVHSVLQERPPAIQKDNMPLPLECKRSLSTDKTILWTLQTPLGSLENWKISTVSTEENLGCFSFSCRTFYQGKFLTKANACQHSCIPSRRLWSVSSPR